MTSKFKILKYLRFGFVKRDAVAISVRARSRPIRFLFVYFEFCQDWIARLSENARIEQCYIISMHGHRAHSYWYWTCVLYAVQFCCCCCTCTIGCSFGILFLHGSFLLTSSFSSVFFSVFWFYLMCAKLIATKYGNCFYTVIQ